MGLYRASSFDHYVPVAAAIGFEARLLLMQTAEMGNLEGFCLVVFQSSDKIAAFLLAVDSNVSYFCGSVRKKVYCMYCEHATLELTPSCLLVLLCHPLV